MLNVIATEHMKLKRNWILIVCSVLAILLPILLLGGGTQGTVIKWLFKLQLLCQLSLYPILSGFIITALIQKEYADLTIINILTAPVGRIKFLFSKMIFWVLWHIIITICFLVISCVGVYVLYDKSTLFENLFTLIKMVMKTGLLNLATLLPVAWIAVVQKKSFYPSLLFTFIITVVGLTGLLQPGLLGSIVPWIAVDLLSIPEGEVIDALAYTSIAFCALIGLSLAVYSFKKQEL